LGGWGGGGGGGGFIEKKKNGVGGRRDKLKNKYPERPYPKKYREGLTRNWREGRKGGIRVGKNAGGNLMITKNQRVTLASCKKLYVGEEGGREYETTNLG